MSSTTNVELETPEEGKRFTAYFRCEFRTGEEYDNLALRCQRDDGVIVYLDGKEVARNNMRVDLDGYRLLAQSSISEGAEEELVEIPLSAGKLSVGEHVLAISLHNVSPTSSDLRLGEISLIEMSRPLTPGGIPKRPVDLDPKQLDLSDYYNASLYDSKGWATHGGYNLANLPLTFKPRHGVAFDLRGILQLQSGQLPSKAGFPEGTINERHSTGFPKRIEGIAVDQTTGAIHFLTSCQWGTTAEGEPIAQFVMNYEDGSREEMPVRIGVMGVLDWCNSKLEDDVLGWSGTNQAGASVSLSELTWENPHPEKTIKTIDFVSALSSEGAPFLVAITLE